MELGTSPDCPASCEQTMSELIRIAEALVASARSGLPCVLATVVRTEGSTYRRIGARLVVRADGTRTGVVSAGCLEHDIVARATGVTTAGVPEVVRYDTRSPDDLVWGFGLGCGGVVEVLLEPLVPDQAASKASRLRRVAETRHLIVLATIIRAPSGTDVGVGDQGVLPGLRATLDGLGGSFHAEFERCARDALRGGRSVAVCHAWKGETIDVAYEIVTPRLRLAVCGAGNDAVPVVAAARRLDWHVTLIDDRLAAAATERWPDADRILVPRPNEITESVFEADSEAAVIMSHHFERDADFLVGWLGTRARYIGLMGPGHRTNALMTAVQARGATIDAIARERMYGPVGLDIGAETPEEIAVAIVAEVQAVCEGRPAGFLSNRPGPIHPSESAPSGPNLSVGVDTASKHLY
jgi:xanthine dehydrogenase accessory factor